MEYTDAWSHIMNRSRPREPIFTGKQDYRRILDLLQEASKIRNVHVTAYLLMPNYYHFLVQTAHANISSVSRRGIFNELRNVAIYLIWGLRGGVGLRKTRKQFQMDNKYSSVGCFLERMKALLAKDRSLRGRVERLISQLSKS